MEWLRQKLVEIVSGEFCMEWSAVVGAFKAQKKGRTLRNTLLNINNQQIIA
jgi:hypothetical protein